MKTKELIRLLQEEDPSGEMDCVIDNQDILYVCGEISYWDGCKQILIRDETKDCYNVIGAEYRSDGWKLSIVSYGIYDALCVDPDLPVKVVDTFVNKKLQEYVDTWRKEIKEMKRQLKKLKNKRKE
jgi:hypothetical protein